MIETSDAMKPPVPVHHRIEIDDGRVKLTFAGDDVTLDIDGATHEFPVADWIEIAAILAANTSIVAEARAMDDRRRKSELSGVLGKPHKYKVVDRRAKEAKLIDLRSRQLEKLVASRPQYQSAEACVYYACEFFGVRPETAMHGASRLPRAVSARMYAFYLMFHTLGMSIGDIQRLAANRGRTSVQRGIERAKREIEETLEGAKRLEILKRKIKELPTKEDHELEALL